MTTYNITIQDQDAKVLEPILKRLSVDFTKKTIKEVEDLYALKKENEWLKSPVLSEKETKAELKKMGINI